MRVQDNCRPGHHNKKNPASIETHTSNLAEICNLGAISVLVQGCKPACAALSRRFYVAQTELKTEGHHV